MAWLPRLPLRLTTWWILLGGALAFGVAAWQVSQPSGPAKVILLESALPSRGRDVGPGLDILVSDLLEILGGATLTHAKSLPGPGELQQLAPDTHLVRVQGSRAAEGLALDLQWNTAGGLISGRPWNHREVAATVPFEALTSLVAAWPFSPRRQSLEALVPRSAARFWELLEAASIRDDLEAAGHLEASQRLAEAEPACATAWATLGDHLYRSLWVNPQLTGVGLNSRTHQAFRRAVELVPGHPRATFLWSLMLTDTGNQALAIEALRRATDLRPKVPDLYLGLAYAGRTAGLLEGARRAIERRQALLGPTGGPSAWVAETTYLYLGDRAAFQRELAKVGALRQDASVLFYQGYLALLNSDTPAAMAFMRRGGDPAMGPIPFRDLCRVYLAQLEGRRQEGLRELRDIDEIRGKLHVPDGEWTFKEAEAYAILGDADRAVDCATRAFVQGFSCARWYESSPLLASARSHPRWPTLIRNVRERQAVLEGTFPPSAFLP